MSERQPMPEMDETGVYPSEDTLEAIREWGVNDARGCLEFCREAWRWGEDYWWTEDGRIHAATGGWSGNEDIIGALRENVGIWVQIWVSSHRGGKYVFDLPADLDTAPNEEDTDGRE